MSKHIINSEAALFSFLGEIRQQWMEHKYLTATIKVGRDRSLPQNNITHAWYEQLAKELREDDALGWKSYCKLNFGVPILRAEDEEFRTFYDGAIKANLTYEQKLAAMKYMPVTSLMTKVQLSKYAEALQQHFQKQGVMLSFPDQEAA